MFNITEMNDELRSFCGSLHLVQYYRLVEPETHSVYDYNKTNTLIKSSGLCYEIWNRRVACKNCISKRTCYNDEQYMKIEYLDGHVLMIFAVPVEIQGRRLSLELIKDVTESMAVASNLKHDMTDVTEVIREFNELAIHDTFTGLYNKSYTYNEIGNFIEANKTTSETLAAVMMDIDSFKGINDTYGHIKGDEVIKHVGKTLSEATVADGCWASRVGGDEFVMLFKNKTAIETEVLCRRLEKKISSYIYDIEGRSFNINISYGISLLGSCDTVQSFLDRADKQMYEHKRKKLNMSGKDSKQKC